MRPGKHILTVIAVIFGIFYTNNGYSQDVLEQEPTPEIRELAEERSEMWAKELALSAKQQELVEQEIIEYTMKRLQIQNSRIPHEEKIDQLLALESMEKGEMRDILTKIQYDR